MDGQVCLGSTVNLYIPRKKGYNPEVICPANEVQIVGNSEFDLVCELATGHDAEYHTFLFANNIRITWRSTHA
ncbi:MAG: hypothetical protein QOC92_4489 [Acidimicrobiaceae bacterium]